jgi:hypothetical protein
MGLYWNQKLAIGLLTFSVIALFFIPAYKLWDNSKIMTDRLTTIESNIQDIGLTHIKIGRGNSNSEVVYLKLKGLEKRFGIYYTDKPTRESYLAKIHVGDKVRLTFNASGPETEEGLNLHIFELQHNGQSLIIKDQVDNKKSTFSKIMLGLGTIFLIWPYLLYRYAVRKNLRERAAKARLPTT